MSREIGCAVIGLGLMGSVHARILARMPHAALKVCCDVDASAAERCPEGTRFTDDVADALAEPGVEAVIIATPERFHSEITIAALGRGLHVFCEKAMATTLEEADAMIAAERDSGRRLVIGHVLRFDPRYVAVRERVAAGVLGRPIHMVTRRNSSYAEGRNLVERTTLPMYLSVHDFDALQWIAGSRITRVFAEAAQIRMAPFGGVDTVVATLRFDDGSVGLHEISWALPDAAGLGFGDYHFSFTGTRGCAQIRILDQGVTIYGGGDEDPPPDATPAWSTGAQGSFEYPETTYLPEVLGVPSGIYMAQLEHFLTGVEDGGPPALSSEDARSALAATLALETAVATGALTSVDGEVSA